MHSGGIFFSYTQAYLIYRSFFLSIYIVVTINIAHSFCLPLSKTVFCSYSVICYSQCERVIASFLSYYYMYILPLSILKLIVDNLSAFP